MTNDGNFSQIRDKYSKALATHGDSPAALFWPKGRQEVRFHALIEPLLRVDERNLSLCDFGSGLGHMQEFIDRLYPKKFDYRGYDMVPELVHRANAEGRNVQLITPDQEIEDFDAIVCSGVFNLRYYDEDQKNKTFVLDRIRSLLSHARRYFACDFMRPDVDYRQPSAWHQPLDILVAAVTECSRDIEIVMRELPYEYTLRVYKSA